jgi:hypothetical protein
MHDSQLKFNWEKNQKYSQLFTTIHKIFTEFFPMEMHNPQLNLLIEIKIFTYSQKTEKVSIQKCKVFIFFFAPN